MIEVQGREESVAGAVQTPPSAASLESLALKRTCSAEIILLARSISQRPGSQLSVQGAEGRATPPVKPPSDINDPSMQTPEVT